MWTSARPGGGASVCGLLPAALAPMACALPCASGVVSGDVDVAALDVALLLAGAATAGVDEASVLVVDVATGTVAVTGVDDAVAVVDVAATWARTGLKMANPITSVRDRRARSCKHNYVRFHEWDRLATKIDN